MGGGGVQDISDSPAAHRATPAAAAAAANAAGVRPPDATYE